MFPGIFCWLLTAPNSVELILLLGTPNCTRFKALNASARNCNLNLSRICVFLNTEMSKLSIPAQRRFGMMRGALPKVNGALNVNTDVSKYFNSRLVTGPLSVAFFPLQFGRCEPAKDALPFPPLTCKGNPLWNVVLPLICQPPTILLSGPLWLRSGLPVPKGSSQTELRTRDGGQAPGGIARSPRRAARLGGPAPRQR